MSEVLRVDFKSFKTIWNQKVSIGELFSSSIAGYSPEKCIMNLLKDIKILHVLYFVVRRNFNCPNISVLKIR